MAKFINTAGNPRRTRQQFVDCLYIGINGLCQVGPCVQERVIDRVKTEHGRNLTVYVLSEYKYQFRSTLKIKNYRRNQRVKVVNNLSIEASGVLENE